MYRERCKATIHALDTGTSSLHEIHHMNRVIHRDGVRPGKCIADCVDKFAAVQSGALYFTVFCFFHRSGLADDKYSRPFLLDDPQRDWNAAYSKIGELLRGKDEH